MEFDWNNYLEDTKSVAVPEELFSHVETSLNNGIKQGMLLEVCHKTNPDMYWIAEITMVCAHLLRIKFIGAESDFWCDISKTKVHPLGWCGKYDELIEPPDDINSRCGNGIIELMKQALLAGRSVSIEALNNKGLSPIDRIKVGMKVEIQYIIDPYRYWIATVCENAGGRLLLRYDGADDDLPQFWMFFCNPRISSFGFVTNKGSPWQFKYPGKVNKFSCKNKLSAQLRQSAEEAISEPTPADLFQPNQTQEAHSFTAGMKVEALSPSDFSTIRPATVLKIFNNLHFLVVLDDHIDDYEDTKMAWLCDNMHPYIYPIGWAQRNRVEFKPPKVWKEGSFEWEEYLSMTASVPAPDYCFGNKEFKKGIEVNMKLEAVNPLSQSEIHVACVRAVAEHMLHVELLPVGARYWYAQDSDLLFPAGWCDTNGYELHIPDTNRPATQPVTEDPKPAREDPKNAEEWCDRIYFNYKCYSGDCHVDPLLPAGWCDTNGYELHIPDTNRPATQPVTEDPKPAREDPKNAEEWCDRIYFNYKCYSGDCHVDPLLPAGWCDTNGYELHIPDTNRPATQPVTEDPKPAREDPKNAEEWCDRIYFNYKCYSGDCHVDPLLPAGWCDTNGYELHIPDTNRPATQPVTEDPKPAREDPKNAEEWCDRIYFNYKCYSGDCHVDPLLPAGWCDTNGYELHIPDTNRPATQPVTEDPKPAREDPKNAEEWCDRIYFNYKCYSGDCHVDPLLPAGWCDTNGYELHIPDTNRPATQPVTEDPKPAREDPKNAEEWCDRIYFNYKCYSGDCHVDPLLPAGWCDTNGYELHIPDTNGVGPSISRNKLSQLPKHVGPGPLLLVLKEVLNKTISASYKPAKLLKDWETEGPPEEGMRLEMLRAKLKSSTYHAYVPIATSAARVAAFCRAVCVRLQACPSLLGPVEYPDHCPNHCQQVEKSTFHNGTERRGRPKGSVNGKRKKKKGAPEKREKEQPPIQEAENNRDGESVESEHSAASTPPSESGTRPNSPDSVSDYKRNTRRKREAKNNHPKLEMKTRGAKLPNFALQMKEAHWNKKDVETIYNNSCSTKKQQDSDTENETNESSCNSRDAKNISDVSDSEEPELKKLKFHTDDPLPSDNKMFEKDTAITLMKGKIKLGRNPLDWTVEDVYNYLNSTEDCKLIADRMKQEEIDGEAFIMLDLPTITEFLHMKKEFAIQLCKHIAMIRWYCIDNFEESTET